MVRLYVTSVINDEVLFLKPYSFPKHESIKHAFSRESDHTGVYWDMCLYMLHIGTNVCNSVGWLLPV